jgi:hypothetical protein
MNTEQKLTILQTAYAAALVDALSRFEEAGVLKEVVEKRRSHRGGAQACRFFGVTTPREIFTRLSELFGCAAWELDEQDDGFTAMTKGCRLHQMAARAGAPSPCDLYCLEPMRDLLEALEPEARFEVENTLASGACCRVRVRLR